MKFLSNGSLALEILTFQEDNALSLALTVETVEISDKALVESALSAYDLLSPEAQSDLTVEKALENTCNNCNNIVNIQYNPIEKIVEIYERQIAEQRELISDVLCRITRKTTLTLIGGTKNETLL